MFSQRLFMALKKILHWHSSINVDKILCIHSGLYIKYYNFIGLGYLKPFFIYKIYTIK